jgi:hypothetical protein
LQLGPTLGYTCQCLTGWTGVTCQTAVDICSSSPCLNSGICSQISSTSYNCTCPTAWAGANCETNVDECHVLTQPCQNSVFFN